MSARQNVIDSITDEEQRIFLKFYHLLGCSSGIAERDLKKAVGRKALNKNTVGRWLTRFRRGDPATNDARGGDRSDPTVRQERISQIIELLEETKRTSVYVISRRLGIPKTSVHHILKEDLHLAKKLGRYVPDELTDDQRQHRVLACQTNLSNYQKHKELLNRTLALDESWVSLYMQPQRDQLGPGSSGGSHALSVPRESIHKDKRMLLLAMDFDGIAWYHICEEKETVTAELYKSILEREIPKWLHGKSFKVPVLLHDNAGPHKAKVVSDFLEHKGITEWYQPPYSPDISPCDYDAFGPLKRALREGSYADWSEFETRLKHVLYEGSQKGFYRGVQHLPERWKATIQKKGDYI